MNFDLTPVEKIGGLFFKREDKFKPFPFSRVNGSKLRQCIMLLEKNKEQARNGIITATSILSPQAVITSAVAKNIGVDCTIMYGGTTAKKILSMPYPTACLNMGSKIKIVANTGRTAVIGAKAKEFQKENGGYVIRYGFDMKENIDCFLESVSEQVKNIPDELENIVVTVGSAITIVGILYGISLYGKKVRNVFGVGVAPNRQNKIGFYLDLLGCDKIVQSPLHYIDAFNKYKGFKYENVFNEAYYGIRFHPRYEAKAFRWLRASHLEGETLFWITGGDIV